LLKEWFLPIYYDLMRVNSVKNIDLTKSVFAALLLVSTVVSAEDKYPASDFQPKVVYQDEEAAKQSEGSASAKSSSSASSSASSSDSQYPAANFEPKVLYSDAEYKHTASAPSSSSSSSSASVADSSSSAAVIEAPKEESSVGYLLGLIVLAAAGFVLFKKGASAVVGAGQGRKAASVAKISSGGLTGVAKYVLKVSGTGVSRYVEKNAKSTAPSASVGATGVAKYLASQVSSAKSTASQAATGVEKYMRKKG
jgi:hypothetical protein